MAEAFQNVTNDREVVAELRAATSQILQQPDVTHELSRAAVLPLEGGAELELSQLRFASLEEQQKIREVGAAAFASQDWFDDVNTALDHDKRGYYNDLLFWVAGYIPGEASDTSTLFSYNFSDRQKVGDGPWFQRLHDPRTLAEVPINFANPEDLTTREELIQWSLGQLATNPTVWYRKMRGYAFSEPKSEKRERKEGELLSVVDHTVVREGSAPIVDGVRTGDMILQVADTTSEIKLANLTLHVDGRAIFELYDESIDDLAVRPIDPDEKTERLTTILARIQEKVAA